MIAAENLIAAVIKRRYEQRITETIQDGVKLLRVIPDEKPKAFGEKLYFAVEVALGAGFGARAGGINPLPKSTPAQHKQAEIDKRRIYATAVFDDILEWNVKGGEAAFIDGIKLVMDGAVRQARWQQNRMAHGDGTGKIAIVNGGHVDATTLTISHPFGFSYGGTQYCQEETLIAVGEVVGGVFTNSTPTKITGRDWDAQTITVSPSIDAPDGAVIVLGDDQGHSYNLEYIGLEGLFGNSGMFQGINADTYPRWRSYIDAVNGPYDWNDILDLCMAIDSDENKKKVLMWHKVMGREHQRANEGNVLFSSGELEFKRGYKTPAIQYGSETVGVVETLWNPYETVYAWEEGAVVHAPIKKWGLDDRGGTVKQLQGTDASYSKWKAYGNYALKSRKNTGKKTGIHVDHTLLKAIQARA